MNEEVGDEETLSVLEENLDGENIVVEGVRRSRRSTNWLYRGSSMTTTDAMDIEMLQEQSIEMETCLCYISSTFAAIVVLAKARLQHGMIDAYWKLQKVMEYLSVAITWFTSQLEMIFLDIEDKMYFVHRVRRFDLPKMRTIREIEDNNESESMFGFKKTELELLLLHCRIPKKFKTHKRQVFTGEEAMLVYLYHIRSGTPYTRMTLIFGGDPRDYTYYVRAITNHLYHNFYHKISGDSMRMWVPFIDEFRHAIWDKLQSGIVNERRSDGTITNWEVWIPFESFRIFGWLDDTDMRTNRPRPGNRVDHDGDITDVTDSQVDFYK
jgi:hypothetical protein